MSAVLVALGSALGGLARHGCVLLGMEMPAGARHFFVIGFCGGFTTFSAFSIQVLEMALAGAWARALSYVVASLALCFAAVALGWFIASGWRA